MKNLLILLFVTGSIICSGQAENQKSFQNSIAIGAGIGYEDYTRSTNYGLTYQRELKNNWRLQASLYTRIGQAYDYSTHYSMDSSIVHVNTRIGQTNWLLKLGGIKTFFEKFFVGADLNIGYQTRYLQKYYNTFSHHYELWNDNYEVNEGDTMEYIGYNHTPYGTLIVNSDPYITRELLYGLSLNIGIQLPICNRWDLILQYSPQFLMARSLDSNYKGLGTGVFGQTADLMLRFKF